jgi:leucyl-tRNA synthetase
LIAPAGTPRPARFSSEAAALRRTTHRTLAAVTDNIEGLRFNVAVARIYEVVNAIASTIQSIDWAKPEGFDRTLGWTLRESLEILTKMVAPMMPHLAEECWAALGYATLVAVEPWPQVERDLLVEDTVTLPVQVNGKKRADVTVARNAGTADIQAAVLALEAVRRALDGKPPKKVIVVPQRIVNVVA